MRQVFPVGFGRGKISVHISFSVLEILNENLTIHSIILGLVGDTQTIKRLATFSILQFTKSNLHVHAYLKCVNYILPHKRAI